MARWTDIATWRGNGANQGPGGMVEHRGLVLHIAVGWYEGTIAWQRNPASRVSSHFVVGREQGELAQMVDTATRAWTQGDGNGRWLSSENEGFLASDSRNPGGWEKLSPWQVEANAQILAKAHLVYGVPLAVAVHPGQKGLGHHSMDREWLDEQWGHDECPGAVIVAQKPAIVARAKEIVGGDDVSAQDVWSYDPNDPTDKGAIRNPAWRHDAESNPTVQPAFALYDAWNRIRDTQVRTQELAAGQAAILAAVAGKDVTAAVRAELDRAAVAERAERAAEQAALRDGLGVALLAELGPALVAELGEAAGELSAAVVEAAVGRALARTSLTVAGPEPA